MCASPFLAISVTNDTYFKFTSDFKIIVVFAYQWKRLSLLFMMKSITNYSTATTTTTLLLLLVMFIKYLTTNMNIFIFSRFQVPLNVKGVVLRRWYTVFHDLHYLPLVRVIPEAAPRTSREFGIFFF